MPATILDGKATAAASREELTEGVAARTTAGLLQNVVLAAEQAATPSGRP